MAALPGDVSRSWAQAAAAVVANRASTSAVAPPICSPTGFETRRTCTARAAYCAVVAAVVADDRDAHNYRGVPSRDLAADSEKGRKASCGGS